MVTKQPLALCPQDEFGGFMQRVFNRKGSTHERAIPQILRSLCLVAATCFFFGGLRYLPLAENAAISFLAPVLISATESSAQNRWPSRCSASTIRRCPITWAVPPAR